MASIHKRTVLATSPEEAWSALSDWEALDRRLVRGFVTGVEMDGPDRIVTFFNGRVAREVLVSCDEEEMRIAWTIVDGPYRHHHGVAQVSRGEDGATVFEWRADVLPEETAVPTAEMMERGIEAVRMTLDGAGA